MQDKKDFNSTNGSKEKTQELIQKKKKKKSRPGHGCLSPASVVCCQVEVSATSWSLVQRSATDCGVSNVCDRETSTKRGGPGPYRAVEPLKKKYIWSTKYTTPLWLASWQACQWTDVTSVHKTSYSLLLQMIQIFRVNKLYFRTHRVNLFLIGTLTILWVIFFLSI
jgi:hypothetical protein